MLNKSETYAAFLYGDLIKQFRRVSCEHMKNVHQGVYQMVQPPIYKTNNPHSCKEYITYKGKTPSC